MGKEEGIWHKCQEDFSVLFPALLRCAPKSDAFRVVLFFPAAAFKTQVVHFKIPDMIGIKKGKCDLRGFLFVKRSQERIEISLPVEALRVPCAPHLSSPRPLILSLCPLLLFPLLTSAAPRFLLRGGGILFISVISN